MLSTPIRFLSRRLLPIALLLLALLSLALPVAAQNIRIMVQSSPLAGFQYYAGQTRWEEMQVGDALELTREPGNPHDANAVRVDWRGQKLGYLPRAENRAVALEMDRGTPIAARISQMVRHRNPWQRVRIEVFVVL